MILNVRGRKVDTAKAVRLHRDYDVFEYFDFVYDSVYAHKKVYARAWMRARVRVCMCAYCANISNSSLLQLQV